MDSPDGKPPFTDEELKQLIREIAIGIYEHDEVPFFSLHFNADGTLYPVIHPVYQNTLVGRVIGMLDYMMKGYLNGGTFEERFALGWEKFPTREEKALSSELISLKEYCKQHDITWAEVRLAA